MRTTQKMKQAVQRQVTLLPFFPGGHPDETLGSRAIRYHLQRGNSSVTKTYKEMFGIAPFPLTFTVQPHLDKLAERLPGPVADNLSRLERDNTLMPLFRLFNGTNSTEKIAVASTSTKATTSRRVVGSTHMTKLCPDCLVDDEKEYGVPYIHRSHQIPSVTACWRHGRALLDRCPTCGCPYSALKELITTAWRGCPSCGKKTEELVKEPYIQPSKTEMEFANFAKELLNSDLLSLSNVVVFKMYIQRAQEMGLSWGADRINRQKLLKKARSLFGGSLLARIDPVFKTGKLSGWFRAMESTSIEAPLHRHLIVSFILFRNLEQFKKSARKILEAELKQFINPLAPEVSIIDKKNKEAAHLVCEVVQIATRHGYDIKQLWLYRFSTMQSLVKLQPDAVKILEKKLKAKPKAPKQIKVEGRTIGKDTDSEDDIRWRDSIIAAAKKIYEEEIRPTRISANRILLAAGFSPKGCRYPSESRFPLARATAAAYSESLWHFYARRMIWTLQSLVDINTSACTLIRLAGLELYKGRAILEYFHSTARGGGASISGITTILEKYGISRDWTGPCPERSFYSAGRAYRLRTNRRGNIGDKASDHRLVVASGVSAM